MTNPSSLTTPWALSGEVIMRATVDRDHVPLERWPEMAEAETAVVYDARLGGFAITVCVACTDSGEQVGKSWSLHRVPDTTK